MADEPVPTGTTQRGLYPVVSKTVRVLDRIVDTQKYRSEVGSRLGELESRLRTNQIIGLPDGYKRVYFHHLRKTGGTALVFAFYRLSGTEPHDIDRRLSWFNFAQMGSYRYAAHSERLIRAGRFFFATSHLPLYMSDPPTEGTFRFTVLRDPIDRIVSLYRYLSDSNADTGFAFAAPVEQRYWARGDFDSFLNEIPAFHLSNQLYSYSSTANLDEALEKIGSMHVVLRTDELSAGSELLSKRLGLPLAVQHERASRSSFQLSPAQRARATEMLASELRFVELATKPPAHK